MKILSKLLCTILFLLLFSLISFADQPPDPGGGPGGGDDPVGGGSPLGSGMIFMVILSSAYSIRNIFNHRKKLLG
jgi:hypothetical protein